MSLGIGITDDDEMRRRLEQMRMAKAQAEGANPSMQRNPAATMWSNAMAIPIGLGMRSLKQLYDLYQRPSTAVDQLPVAGTIKRGAELTGDVLEGKVDPRSEEGIGRVAGTALDVVTEGGNPQLKPGEVAFGAGRIDPKVKAEMDLRRTYQGQGARTHPQDWNYQLGGNTPTMAPVKDFDVNNLREGDTFVPLIGDRSRVSAPLVELQGKKLPAAVSAEGGSDYTRTPEGGVWASNSTIPQTLQNKAAQNTTGTPFGVTVAMGPTSLDYSHHTWEPLLWGMENSPATSAARQQFDKEFRRKHPDWPGLDNPERAAQYLQSEKTTARTPFVGLMQTKKYQQKGFPEPGPVRWAMTEPDLRRVPTGATGYNVAKLDPQGKVIPDVEHTDYATGVPGEYAGRMPALLPYEKVFRDWANRPDIKSIPASKESNKLYKFRMDAPVQKVDARLMDELARLYEAAKRGR